MKIKNLTDLWILNNEGKEFFQFSPKPSITPTSNIIHNLFAGIQIFMRELGNDEIYQISVEDSYIIGLKLLKLPENSEFREDIKNLIYIVGKFSIKQNKKSLNYIHKLAKFFEKVQWPITPEEKLALNQKLQDFF
ncbi:MAG: hypothetical protein ACTSVL_06425 [Promethearchaeota archaeon]